MRVSAGTGYSRTLLPDHSAQRRPRVPVVKTQRAQRGGDAAAAAAARGACGKHASSAVDRWVEHDSAEGRLGVTSVRDLERVEEPRRRRDVARRERPRAEE